MSSLRSQPLVFYCRGCKSIVGDSLNVVSTEEALEVLVLERIHRNVRESEVETEKSLLGGGRAAVRALRCASCEATLGHFYVRVPRSALVLRGRYALETRSIRSYELGKAEGDDDDDLVTRVDRLETDLKDDIRKVQGVLLALHERVQALEAAVLHGNNTEDNNNNTIGAGRRPS